MAGTSNFHVLFTPSEMNELSEWDAARRTRKVKNRILSPVFERLALLVPDNVAPNILTLCGLLCILQAYYLCHFYLTEQRWAVVPACILLIITYQILDGVDGKHARRIRNLSVLGELFDHMCDAIGAPFLVLTVCSILGVDEGSVWYLVQASLLLFLFEHVEGFRRKSAAAVVFTKPGKRILLVVLVICAHAYMDLTWFLGIFERALGALTSSELGRFIPKDVHSAAVAVFCAAYVACIVQALLLGQKNYSTRNGLLLCLVYRAVPAMLMGSGADGNAVSIRGIICDGLFLSVVNIDVIAANMSGRQLHPFIVVFAMASVFNHLLIIVMCVLYTTMLLYEVASGLNLPIFTVCVNVYIDGVYDLCHLGHKNLFRNAIRFGNRLIVGVVGDADAGKYKRPPIMTCKERCAEVLACKNVTEVVPDAPCFGLTKEFLLKYNIHVCAHSQEYDREDDKYYAVPRQLGMTRVLPRTEGISTSELIRRVQGAQLVGKDQKEKQSKK